MPRPADTIAALATPAGTAALALLRISGPDTADLARQLLGTPPLPRVARHVDFRDQAGALLDDVVVTFFQGPRSYTGEDTLEISCHGNPFIARRMLDDLLARGCRVAEPGEFTQRAFLNGRMDLSQAEAVMDLIHARSERALVAAHQLRRGALGRRMEQLVEELLEVLARIEAYIDFPDEDLPPEDGRAVRASLDRLALETGRLLATRRYGDMLREGIKTVIAGAPNVGKSSLLNRLVGTERALVSPEPGTTRDFIEERIMVGPHGLRLVDTAGLNAAPGAIEKRGMEKTWERLAEADLVLVVVDASRPEDVPGDLRAKIRPESTIVVCNKSDLVADRVPLAWADARLPVVWISALTGLGWEELLTAVQAKADQFQQDVGVDGVAINARHAQALETARTGLESAGAKLVAGAPVELVAADLRSVLAAYGEIVGKVDNERMLDHLFASFCIGK